MSKLPFADKNLGQHYLKDKKIIETITSDFESKALSIIEVGPGPAILTEKLATKDLPLYVIEKDLRFLEILKDHVKVENTIFTDALSFDLQDFIDKRSLQNIWLVSNLPYNISAPLFMKFLPIKEIKFLTLMFQKEVALKILPHDGTKNSQSSLSLLSENYFSTKHLIKAHPGAFLPPPRVESLVLSLQRKDQPFIPLDELNLYETFLRFIFKAKRKQLQAILKERSIKEPLNLLMSIDVLPTIRAEAMKTNEINKLYSLIKGSFQ